MAAPVWDSAVSGYTIEMSCIHAGAGHCMTAVQDTRRGTVMNHDVQLVPDSPAAVDLCFSAG